MQALFVIWLITFLLVSGFALLRVKMSALSTRVTPVSRSPHPSFDHPFMLALKAIDLSADQRARVDAIVGFATPRLEWLGKVARESTARLMTLSPGDIAYPLAVESARYNATAQIKLIGDVQTQILGELTADQRAKLAGVTPLTSARHAA